MNRDYDRAPRNALVLAGGGMAGGLYEVGALLALDAVMDGFSTCDFDLYVGSSAGALIAALLANRVSPERLRESMASDRRTLPRLSGSQFLALPWADYLGTVPRLARALPAVARDLVVHWREAPVLDTLASLVRCLPQGIFSLDGIEHYVRTVLDRPGRTNDFRRLRHPLLVPATALDTGTIKVFGASPRERTPISMAVAASAAVPLLYAPVRIDGVDYVDAAITKTAHAGLAVAEGARLVVVLNPIRPLVVESQTRGPIRDGGPLAVANQALRIALQRRLYDGLRRHGHEHPETDLALLEPYERDIELFDTPLITYALRGELIRRGYRTTVKTLLADYDRYVALFARHGIALLPRAAVELRAQPWSSAARTWADAPSAAGGTARSA
jgi:predicted acylesterase/phospholipase RssA